MTYEFGARWTTKFTFNSPINTNASVGANSAISTTLSYLKDTRRLNPLQIVIGVPVVGWVFNNYTQLGDPKSNTNGADKTYTSLYNDYIKNSPANGWVKNWDDVCKQPYLTNIGTQQMIIYDDENAIAMMLAALAQGHDRSLCEART